MNTNDATRTTIPMHVNGTIVAVLAAGQGKRFGGGKLDANCAGKPLGQYALDIAIAAGFRPGFIVIPHEAPEFAVEARDWDLTVNLISDAGMASSVALAADRALDRGSNLLLILADMPLVEPAHLASLVHSDTVSATRYPDGRAGVPVWIPMVRLPDFMTLEGERGGANRLASQPDLRLLDAPASSLADVDTAEDLARVADILGRNAK